MGKITAKFNANSRGRAGTTNMVKMINEMESTSACVNLVERLRLFSVKKQNEMVPLEEIDQLMLELVFEVHAETEAIREAALGHLPPEQANQELWDAVDAEEKEEALQTGKSKKPERVEIVSHGGFTMRLRCPADDPDWAKKFAEGKKEMKKMLDQFTMESSGKANLLHGLRK